MDNLQNTDNVPQVKLGMFRASEHAIAIGNLMVIDDNLDLSPENRRIGAPVDALPTKVMASLTLLCTEGYMDAIIDQKQYHLERGCCLMCLPGFIAEKVNMSEDCRMIIMATAHHFYGKSPMKAPETIRKWLIQQGSPCMIHLPDNLCSDMVRHYLEFRNNLTIVNEEYHPEILMGFTHALAAFLATWLHDKGIREEASSVPRKKELMIKFLNDVHEFCGKERSISFYAKRCCLSPKYFARIITEMLGKKPGDVIKENVILEAKVMLISRSYSVQQVSDKLNFPNSSFFCKYFKSATGCSPRKYQLNGEKATDNQSAAED